MDDARPSPDSEIKLITVKNLEFPGIEVLELAPEPEELEKRPSRSDFAYKVLARKCLMRKVRIRAVPVFKDVVLC